MAEAGVTKESVKEMQGLVETVKSAQVDDILDGESIAEQRTAVLQKIHAFVVGWSELARIVVPQRAQLIRLGIAKRRAKKGAAQPVVPALPAPVVTAPVVTPVVGATPAPGGDAGGGGDSGAAPRPVATAPVAVPAQPIPLPALPTTTPTAPTLAPSPAPSAPSALLFAHERTPVRRAVQHEGDA